MAELFGMKDDGLFGRDAHNNKPIEICPEMLDYSFVEQCSDVEELRAVLFTLQSGKHGRYPHLEQTTREKLNQLLPNEEKEKVNTIRIKSSSQDDATNEKASLHDWLLSAPKTASTSKKQPDITPTVPVRAVTHTNLGSAVFVPSTKSSTNLSSNHQPPTAAKNNSSTIFRKEKLTTKEYFERWGKFDVDAALAEISDDEDENTETKQSHKQQGHVVQSSDKPQHYHRMGIEEVNNSALNSSNIEVFDDVEEVFTPGAQQLVEADEVTAHISTDDSLEESTPSTATETPTVDSKEDSPHTDHIKLEVVDKTSNWHKVSIIETEEPDEYNTTTGCMKRVEIVEDEDDAIYQSIIQDSDKLKKEGNNSLAAQRYEEAIQFYSLSLDINPSNIAALNNRSIAYTKLERWDNVIINSTSCLEKEPHNTKALYHRGFANKMLGNVEEALADFELLAISFHLPKDQLSAVSKKVDECRKILASSAKVDTPQEADSPHPTTVEKKKVRSYDAQALAF